MKVTLIILACNKLGEKKEWEWGIVHASVGRERGSC